MSRAAHRVAAAIRSTATLWPTANGQRPTGGSCPLKLVSQPMPPQHLDRLSAVDASFLHQEQASSHMHVGAGTIFEGPPPTLDEFLEHLESRLHLVPRYRQKLAFPPLQTGRPFWVDDPNFNLEYHVRHTALPHPGGLEQLRLLASRAFSQRLDRSKPPWGLGLPPR